MPLVKADMKQLEYTGWLKAKADVGGGRVISNATAIKKLVEHFNQTRSRRQI